MFFMDNKNIVRLFQDVEKFEVAYNSFFQTLLDFDILENNGSAVLKY